MNKGIKAAMIGSTLAVLAAGVQAQAADTEVRTRKPLQILCSAAYEWCELLAQRYEARFKVPVKIEQMPTNAALGEIRKGQVNGKYDVWFGGTGEPHLEAAWENLTVPHRSTRLNELHEWASRQAAMSGNRTIGVYAGMLGFIVNEDKLREKNIAIPRCWFNLLRQEYAGLVAMPNPATSGTGYTMIATLVSMMGEDTAFSYMKRITPSIKEYVKSGSVLAQAVSSGETPVAIGFIHDGVRERLKGAPVSVVSPCEGAGYETGSMSIVRGGNTREARRFVDWALSPAVQAFAAEARQYQLPSNASAPVPKGAPRFSDFKIFMAYDPKRFALPDEKRRLTERWEKEVLGAGKPAQE